MEKGANGSASNFEHDSWPRLLRKDQRPKSLETGATLPGEAHHAAKPAQRGRLRG